MSIIIIDPNTKAGVLGGTLFSAFLNLSWNAIVYTIIMAAIGAVVSFIVSMLLRWLVKQYFN
jgi:ABC-type Fe3+ transport system permease subunit